MANSSHLSGAEYMASIFGTEKDMVNCPFFYKIGACRNGIKCKRLHNKPTFSQTVLLKNLYHNPKVSTIMDAGLSQQYQIKAGEHDQSVSDAEEQMHFDEFFEEIFVEVEDKYGEVEEMNVCDNIGEHMIGNVYIKFRKEEDAEACEKGCNERWFGGEPIYAELSPVTDFREACCRQYEMGECTRGGFCNFMHLKPISYELRRELYNRDHPWREAQVPKAPALPALLKDPTRLGSIITANRTAWTQLAEWKRKVTAARRRRALPLPEPDDTRLPLAYLPLPSSSDSEPDSPRLPRPPSDDDDTSSDRAQTPLPLPDPARLSRLTLWRLKVTNTTLTPRVPCLFMSRLTN